MILPRTLGERNGCPVAVSIRKYQTATTIAPSKPVTTPSRTVEWPCACITAPGQRLPCERSRSLACFNAARLCPPSPGGLTLPLASADVAGAGEAEPLIGIDAGAVPIAPLD